MNDGPYTLLEKGRFFTFINSTWHPISYRFRVIAAYYSNFGHLAFLSRLGTTYDVQLGLFGKSVVDFLLVLIELFRYVLQLSRYERKEIENLRFCSNAFSLIKKFQVQGVAPTNHFCTDS